MMDRKTAILMSMGFEIIGVVIFAIYLGRYLDSRFDLNGLGTAGAIAIGFVGWLTHVIIVTKSLTSSDSSKDEPK